MSTNGSKEKKKGFLNSIFESHVESDSPLAPKRSFSVEKDPFPLLDLPQRVRVKIWRLLGFSHTKTLRLVCSLVKEDIDKAVGISSGIDSTFSDFSFHCSIAIRKAVIHELISPSYIEFLKYPEILHELEIRGEISVQNFHYILKSCPNIAKLLFVFNKFILDYKAPYFPLPPELLSLKPLSNLRSIKFVSITKKLTEMIYVHRMAISLFQDSLFSVKINSLHVLLSHRASNVYFREIVWAVILFVHKHVPRLKFLNLTFRDKDVAGSAGENVLEVQNDGNPPAPVKENVNDTPVLPHPSLLAATKAKTSGTGKRQEKVRPEIKRNSIQQRRPSRSSLIQRKRNSGVVKLTHDNESHGKVKTRRFSQDSEGEANVVDQSKSDESGDENDVLIRDAIRHLLISKWPTADNLEQLWLTMPSKYMEELVKMVSPKTKLQVLQLETVGGGDPSLSSNSNWDLYKSFIERGDPQMLKNVRLFAANNATTGDHSLPIDLSIFRDCLGLRRLSILCQRRDNYSKLPRVRGISKLPKTLWEVNFERMLLTPWQVIRLLVCFDEMYCLSAAYWSISDCQFCTLLRALKWAVKLDITDVHQICLVDTKLRFKTKRQAVRSLQEAVSISARYEDLDETRLIIDMSHKQDVKFFAPRILFHTVKTSPAQQPHQQRRMRNSLVHRNNNDNLSISSQTTP